MDKTEAIKQLGKIHYSEILVGDEFVPQEDGSKVRNQMFDIADAFEIKVPIETFQPDPHQPKGALPNHSKKCLGIEYESKAWEEWCKADNGVCPCWKESYTGIAPMYLLDRIAQKYNVYSTKFGRGSAYREKIQKLKEIIENKPIVLDLKNKMIQIPLD